MDHEKRILEAFHSNKIEKILLIDDAYDPPTLDEPTVAALNEFLNDKVGQTTCSECGIDQDTLNGAIVAANEGDTNSGALESVCRTLYSKFVETDKERFDPGGRFHVVKGSAIATLCSLRALLGKCSPNVKVRLAGLENAIECYLEFRPQVLFLDYYLADNVPATGKVGAEIMKDSRQASIDLLRQIVKAEHDDGIPAVVLMSSRTISDIDEYRHDTGEQQIMSLRFQFMNKRHVRQDSGGKFVIDYDAADALLDTSQGYLFGKVLQQALQKWKAGAQSALDVFMHQVGNLHIKDFAYLLRFRLREEEQPLSKYLEWLFGEYLKGLIGNKVDWKHESFSKLDEEDGIGDKIEGAFKGPSLLIAELYHRVRIDDTRTDSHRSYQLGDLYVEPSSNDIRAVITPDCDLFVRKGQANAKNVLTMGGTLAAFNESGAAANDLLLRKNIPYSVQWKLKDLETFPLDGTGSLDEADKFEFLGTLRPLYAQQMQRRALTDLSRIGLPVAPALGINATASVWIRKKDDQNPWKRLTMKSPTLASIIPDREGQQSGHRVLLQRRFVCELIDRLTDIDGNEMNENDAQNLNRVKSGGADKLYEAFLRSGCFIGRKGKLGTGLVLGDTPDKKQQAPWLQIVLKISNEAMEELRMIDPLAAVKESTDG